MYHHSPQYLIPKDMRIRKQERMTRDTREDRITTSTNLQPLDLPYREDSGQSRVLKTPAPLTRADRADRCVDCVLPRHLLT